MPTRHAACTPKDLLGCCRFTQYDNQTQIFADGPPLSQAIGYPLVLGIAAAFVVLTVSLFWLDRRFAGTE